MYIQIADFGETACMPSLTLALASCQYNSNCVLSCHVIYISILGVYSFCFFSKDVSLSVFCKVFFYQGFGLSEELLKCNISAFI